MNKTLDPNLLASSAESLGIELPHPIKARRRASVDALHKTFVGHFDRLAQISEKSPADSLYHRVHGPTNDPDTQRRIGAVHKAIENGGVVLTLSNVNQFYDHCPDYYDYADWKHSRQTAMGLTIPIERGAAVINLTDVSSSHASGSRSVDFDGVKGYADDEDSPKLYAGWKAEVSATAAIEVDFSEVMKTLGIKQGGGPQKKETELKLEVQGQFTNVDMKRAFGIGIAILEAVEPSMLKDVNSPS